MTDSGPDKLNFKGHRAYIVGIDAYRHVSPLRTAVNDAQRLATILQSDHRFTVTVLQDPGGAELRQLLHTTMAQQVGKDDRVLFYFAGHGVAHDGEDGPAGYLVPVDAEPTDLKTFIPMAELQAALDALPCRHLLVILDCCFSGAFKWSSQTRAIGTLMPSRIYEQRFARFMNDAARQIITSAAYDQKALDVLHGKPTGDRGQEGETGHSPFALALFDGLSGAADVTRERESDGVITATEMYCSIRDRIEPSTLQEGQRLRQTPSFFPLKGHDKGEFMFLNPRCPLNLLPLKPEDKPYLGLASFDEHDKHLFYGRDRAIAALRAKAGETGNRLLVVVGASGTGKSSVVKAGLLPQLRAAGLRILPPMRPGAHPMAALAQVLREAALTAAGSPGSAVLLVDQFEELITRCADREEREAFDHALRALLDEGGAVGLVVITVRSDFEPQLNAGALKQAWALGRYTVPPFSLDELREVIVMPTIQHVMLFDPPELVDRIIGEVVQAPGALPLLSYALSELYEASLASNRADRALKEQDYDKLGGVMGALRTKADTLVGAMDEASRSTMRKIMLRMVSVEGDLASKRVAMDDLVFSDTDAQLVGEVLEKLVEARLIVKSRDDIKGVDCIEPAHDALVRAWKTLHDWIHETGRDKLILGTKLNAAARDYAKSGDSQFLWNNNPYLRVVEGELTAPQPWLNANESTFVRKSVELRIDKAREAEREKVRVLLSLFSALKLNLNNGAPGSILVGPSGAANAWIRISRVPDKLPVLAVEPAASRDFIVARHCDAGRVLAYAHDGLTKDEEIKEGSDNLVFAENALRWLAPSIERGGSIAFWPGSFLQVKDMTRVGEFIRRRGWSLKVTTPKTLEADLQSAGILWYASDWNPPKDFAARHVPLIESFVRDGGGLLVGGLGWSYWQYNTQKPPPPYAADELGKPFGFSFTRDAFQYDVRKPIPLDPGR